MRRFHRLASQHALPAGPQRRPAARAERGQAIVIIAMAMIGLLAFIGLTVDAGILFIGVGHLRRAVDAAALAASAQFREGRSVDQQAAAARQVVHLNGVAPTSLELWVCVIGKTQEDALDPATHHDPSLCEVTNGSQPRRKLVRIRAATMVHFAFLTIIGFHDTEISAQAVSEAASVDVVLVIDTSNSMTFDALPSTNPMRDPAVCNVTDIITTSATFDGLPGECHPFEEVKQAAASFVDHLNFPYDRVSVVTFALTPTVIVPLTNTLTSAEILDKIKNLQVSLKRVPTGYPGATPGCEGAFPGENVTGCMHTSTGGGLKYAGNEFGRAPIRQESVWVVILLTDGAANASESDASIIPPTLNKFCPMSTWYAPYCRDIDVISRHTVLTPTIWQNPPVGSGILGEPGHIAPYNPNSTFGAYSTGNPYDNYDADDFAHDMADFVACAPTYGEAAQWCKDSLNYINDEGGQGAVIYAIGLGQLVLYNDYDDNILTADNTDPGDALLRYVSNVGLDGDPNPNPSSGNPDPCLYVPRPTYADSISSANTSYSCGNYYFSRFGTGLSSVFESIASRIFTRLTQ